MIYLVCSYPVELALQLSDVTPSTQLQAFYPKICGNSTRGELLASGSFLHILHTVKVFFCCLVYLQVTSAPGMSLHYSNFKGRFTLCVTFPFRHRSVTFP